MKRFRVGAIDVKIYKTKQGTHIAVFPDWDGKRVRIHRADARSAESAARNHIHQHCAPDGAEERRAGDILKPFGITPIEAARIVAEARQRPSITVAAFYRDFRNTKENRVGVYRQRDFTKHIERRLVPRFGDRPIASILAPEIERWLDALPGTNRTRMNIRATVVTFFRSARRLGYLPEGPTAAEKVERPEPEPPKKEFFSPDEMRKLLAAVDVVVLPPLVLIGFGGMRSEELCAAKGVKPVLHWKHIRWEDSTIRVPADVSKTGECRYIEMQSNLVRWLKPFRDRTGPIFTMDRLDDKFLKLAARARVAWRHNGLRHSYGTYRVAAIQQMGQVALEMGNEETMIKRHYWTAVPKSEAGKWWNIFPPDGFVPMPTRSRRNSTQANSQHRLVVPNDYSTELRGLRRKRTPRGRHSSPAPHQRLQR